MNQLTVGELKEIIRECTLADDAEIEVEVDGMYYNVHNAWSEDSDKHQLKLVLQV